MDYTDKLDNLQKKAADIAAAVKAAAAEDRAQLRQRIEQAQVDANLALKDARDKTQEVAERAQGKWAQLKVDAAAKMDDIKARAERRAVQLDARQAEADAEGAETDAADAIDYAEWAIENARLATLDALDARIQADDLASKASLSGSRSS